MRSNLIGALLGLAAFGMFASVDMSIKFLGAGYNPFQIIFFVSLMSCPIALAYALVDRSDGNLWPRRPGLTLLRCVGVVINGILGTYAFSVLPLAQCYAIFFTMPIFIAVMAVPVLGERIDLVRGLAVVAGLVGVIVALDPQGATLQWGHLAALLASMVGAVNYLIIRLTGGVERVAVLQIYPLLAQLLVAALVLPLVYVPMPVADLGLTALMGLAAFVGYLLIIAAYRHAPAIVVAPMQYSQILWAAIFGAILFQEVMGLQTVIGVLIIIAAGVVIVARQDRPA
ncbi:MAG: hypothetical protein B7Z31_11410 [Rhodobacterales bacterium 12-65-15]|nr:MAG: hypothetical protein B7Z31_11410 [Rhodobacterales bacterium 12-65-15]